MNGLSCFSYSSCHAYWATTHSKADASPTPPPPRATQLSSDSAGDAVVANAFKTAGLTERESQHIPATEHHRLTPPNTSTTPTTLPSILPRLSGELTVLLGALLVLEKVEKKPNPNYKKPKAKLRERGLLRPVMKLRQAQRPSRALHPIRKDWPSERVHEIIGR